MARLLDRMAMLYDYMQAGSTIIESDDYPSYGISVEWPTDTATIWRGSAQSLADQFVLKKHLVDAAIAKLLAMDCIFRLNTGYNNVPSIFMLKKRPTVDEYNALAERSLITGRRAIPSQAQRMNDAITRLTNELAELRQRVERIELVQQNDAVRGSARRD